MLFNYVCGAYNICMGLLLYRAYNYYEVLILYGACRHHTNPVGTEWQWKIYNLKNILKECQCQFRGTVYNVMIEAVALNSYG